MSPHSTGKEILFQECEFLVQGCVFLLHAFDVCEGVAEDFGFLETSRTDSGLFLDSGGSNYFLQREKFGIHVCAVAFLDYVVGGSFGGVAHLWGLA